MFTLSNVCPLSADVLEELDNAGIDYWVDGNDLVVTSREDCEVAKKIVARN